MLPNFIIAGAPKCGTTSLYFYLQQHPEIFFPKIKEPHFFSKKYKMLPFQGPKDDRLGSNRHKDLSFRNYEYLFQKANTNQMIGEASADYIYYSECAQDIYNVLGDVKIIIILRNPIQRAYSAYLNMVRDGHEFLSFSQALNEETNRIRLNWDFMWYYKDVGYYYKNILKFKEIFSNVYICFLDDIKSDINGTVKNLYTFLGVDNEYIPESNLIHNISGIPINTNIYKIINNKYIYLLLKKTFGSLGERINYKMNRAILKKRDIKFNDVQYLKSCYVTDVKKIQSIVGNDLSHWNIA
jgi:hypothetical protein